MIKLTYSEFCDRMTEFNNEHNITTKGCGPTLIGVIVFTEDTFSKPYSLEERSYKVTNQNKAFLPHCCSNSIFGDCLDGIDLGVRLHDYIGDWKVDYCYFL